MMHCEQGVRQLTHSALSQRPRRIRAYIMKTIFPHAIGILTEITPRTSLYYEDNISSFQHAIGILTRLDSFVFFQFREIQNCTKQVTVSPSFDHFAKYEIKCFELFREPEKNFRFVVSHIFIEILYLSSSFVTFIRVSYPLFNFHTFYLSFVPFFEFHRYSTVRCTFRRLVKNLFQQ